MNWEDQIVKVIGVDKERIRESGTAKGAWIIPFKLSQKPDESWGRHFYEVHRKSIDPKKKDVKLVEDCLELSFIDTEDQQQALEYLKKEVEITNAAYKEVSLQKLKMQEDVRVLQLRQVNMMQKLKDDSDKLKF